MVVYKTYNKDQRRSIRNSAAIYNGGTGENVVPRFVTREKWQWVTDYGFELTIVEAVELDGYKPESRDEHK